MFRCPKHDVIFNGKNGEDPTQDGHPDCPRCKQEISDGISLLPRSSAGEARKERAEDHAEAAKDPKTVQRTSQERDDQEKREHEKVISAS